MTHSPAILGTLDGAVHGLASPDHWLTRFVVQRGLAAVYGIAFLVALNQFRPLLGERGLLPAPEFLRRVSFRQAPSLFHVRYSDRLLVAAAGTGLALSLAALLTLTDDGPIALSMASWLVLWALYLSIVNIGQVFYSFGWESLLLEAGFLAIFLGPSGTAPPVLVIWLLRWLVIRLELGAGLIKLRGDPCWRDLSCLDYHHETQPMPNPLSWHFHHLPRLVHRLEVLGNHVAQLVAPLCLLAPQPVAAAGGAVIVVTQLWLLLSGNFSWLNLITIIIAVSAFDNDRLHTVIPLSAPAALAFPTWFGIVAVLVTAGVAGLSWWPVRNLASRRQSMNASFNQLHLVNTYGAFGTVTRVRDEIVIEGTADAEVTPQTRWLAYELRGKPGDPRRRPPQVAPYHLRLDWLMWFAALSPAYAERWFVALIVALLANDPAVTALMGRNPFADAPPGLVRARLYRYRFTSREERARTGAWWSRTLVGEHLPPVGRSSSPTRI